MTTVLYEDDDILAVDKPEGIASIPERVAGRTSLQEVLSRDRPERLYVVHRLDKEASGVIVFAMNAEAHRCLCRQFHDRTVDKSYLALVHGVLPDAEGIVDKPIRQFGSGRMGIDARRGKAGFTKWRVAERFSRHTLVEAKPVTGRRHQIRVHLYSLGHPIVGDPLYGDKTVQYQYDRLMLHAQRLTLTLPSGRNVTIEAPLPKSFRDALCAARRGGT